MVDARSVLFLGRHVGYPVALEGALKLKELAYIHAEGFAAGELKHGPIALIEDGLPVLRASCLAQRRATSCTTRWSRDIQEIRARGARTIVHRRGGRRGRRAVRRRADPAARDADAARSRWWPSCRCRCSRCELATAKGHDVDQPRNLAKSVTVE